VQTTPGTEQRREIVRLAIAAALISFLLPLLPLYDGFFPWFGFPLRGLISFFLAWWTNTAVVAVGILYLRRDRIGVAGGVFLAVALTLAITITGQVLQTAPHFGSWQTDLFLVLEIIEGVLLALAAVRAMRARSA
jgi:cytosine/uracil/thiamine/allantoin permease